MPFALVFTKTDKLNQRERDININQYKKTLLEHWEELPPIFLTSAEKHVGKEEMLTYIDSINQQLKKAR